MRKVDINALYDKDLNTWIRKDGDKYKLGLTDWAQAYFKKVSCVHFNCKKGVIYKRGYPFVEIESDKTNSEINLPITIKVLAINDQLLNIPSLVNKDCYGAGWLLEIELEDLSEYIKLKDSRWYEESINSFFRKDS